VGGSPSSFYVPDLYCSGSPGWLTCTEYDPDEYFELTLGFDTYLCQDTWSFQQYDCVTYRGGQPPSFVFTDLYCSGGKSWPDCSSDWYPDELADYTFVTISGSPHICQPAFLGGWDDYDCGRYNGGNPDRVSYGMLALKCTESWSAMECATDYYPSEWEGLELMRIDFSDYVCKSTWQGNECYRWYGSGSPKSATYGLPEYYCNSWGDCARNGYP